jgi:hypothetical protein
MTGALALEDIGAVCPVLVATPPAPQNVDVLVMVRAGKVGSTDNDLPVSVPVAWLGRPLTHSAQYTDHQRRSSSFLGLQSHLNVPSNGEHCLAREKIRRNL